MSSVGMKDEHRQLLRRLKPDIIKDLNAGKVVECMSDIFDEEDEQNITYSKPPIDQARKLIDILLTKGPTAFDKFVTACESCHKHIAKKLKEESGSTDAQSQDAVLKEAIMFIYNEVTLAQCLKVTRCLGLSTVDQDTIRNNFQNDAETQKHRMFVKWQEKKKQNANVDELVKQLNENGCTQQSEDMLKHLQEKGYDHLALSFGNLQISSPDQSARQPVQCTTTQDQVPTHSQGAAASVTSQRGVVAPPPPPPVAPPPSDPVLSQEAEDDFKSLPDFTATQFQSLMKRLKITKEQQRQIGENELSVWNFINFWGNSKQRQTAREVVKAVEKLLKRSDIGNTLRKHLQPGTAGPREDENTGILSMDFKTRHELSLALSIEKDDLHDWRGIAYELGFSTLQIQCLERQKMEGVLKAWDTDQTATVGKFYDILVKLGMTAYASKL